MIAALAHRRPVTFDSRAIRWFNSGAARPTVVNNACRRRFLIARLALPKPRMATARLQKRLIERGISMKRKASAEWKGGLKDGKGTISTDSGVLANTQYSFGTRFEDGKGTNPEELIAAAHAGCFSMALSGKLADAGLTAERINTTANVTLEKTDAGFTITSVHLDVSAKIPGADSAAFTSAAEKAKAGCPVSRLLNAKITMDAKLAN